MKSSDKELVKGYVQKAQKKLEVAKRLFTNGDYEDSVSRSYYAVFHAAQGLLLTEGEHASTHKGVLTLFSLLFVKTGRFMKNLGKYLSNLKDDRESGDYEIFSYIDEDTADTALREAEEFINQTILYLQKTGLMD
ncbi:MAG: HEPN domain-containing protein [Nitrospirae bacterium]|nr:HEPN domain-containing protein [Nitrospirota bacterium]